MAIETVKIKLPLTKTEKDDVYVAVNGESFLIKRGEYVEVPKYVLEVLDNREKMLTEAFAFEDSVANK